MAKRKRSFINFDKTIFGVNVTESGPQSASKSIKLGPLRLTLNGRKSGVRASPMSKGPSKGRACYQKLSSCTLQRQSPKLCFCRNQLTCLHKRIKIRHRSAQGTRSIEKRFQVVQQQLAKTTHSVTQSAQGTQRG